MKKNNANNQTTATTSPSAKDDDIKKWSRDQRAALPDEPKCVNCGRFGEYICDETDDDICSLECKHAFLSSHFPPPPPPTSSPSPPPSKIIIDNDECFYVKATAHPSSSSTSDDPPQLLRNKLGIHVTGASLPPPILSFPSCHHLPQKLLHNIPYDVPTPVQMQAIPAALDGRSLLVSAETGSGKTASFLIPLISRCASVRLQCPPLHHIQKPLAVVLAPTRELCMQVEDQAKLLGNALPFKTALVVGGDAMPRQLHRIQQGVEMIVATPGRLIDLLVKHDIELDDVMMFVLDEFDCLLQRGFLDQVMQIFRALSNPQVLMYSATTSQVVEKTAVSLNKDIVFIHVGQPNRPNKAVKQLAIWVQSKQKKQKLLDILTNKLHFTPPAVVFVNSRIGADLLSNAITTTTGLKALSIHGEKSMKERREIMEAFLMGEAPVIVATGVLGRGVDLLQVRQVIVFDMPNSIREYVHQIGRASRMGDAGKAFVFVNEESKHLFPELVEVLKSAGATVPCELVNSRYTMCSATVGRGCQGKRKYGS